MTPNDSDQGMIHRSLRSKKSKLDNARALSVLVLLRPRHQLAQPWPESSEASGHSVHSETYKMIAKVKTRLLLGKQETYRAIEVPT
jgi:hypothetical protein